MKMHKFEIYVIDHENLGPQSFMNELEYLDYVSVRADFQGTADIGEWEDSHPLNFRDTKIKEFRKYFKEVK